MPQITFEKLKQECVREFCTKTTRGYHGEMSAGHNSGEFAVAILADYKATGIRKNVRDFVKQVEDDCVAAVERTDLRNLKPLISLCPQSVPQWIKNNNYTLDLTDKGWTFFKKEFL